MLSGLPGAGKDLWIAHHGDGRPVVSLDDLRRERDAKRADKAAQGQLIQEARELARKHLRKHEPFIWNATNLTAQLRGQTLSLLADYHAHVTIVAVEAPADELSRRNRSASTRCPRKRSSGCSTAGRHRRSRSATGWRSGAPRHRAGR